MTGRGRRHPALAAPRWIGYLLVLRMGKQNSRRIALRALATVLLAVAMAGTGCARRGMAPTASPIGEQAPVTLRSLEIKSVDGHRAILLRLSRLPTLLRHSSSRNPGSITIEAWGPAGDADLEERILPQEDEQIAQVRVSRRQGGLRVVFDLHANEPPPHAVHEMADWVMVRFTESPS